MNKLKAEIKMLSRVNHANIVSFHGASWDQPPHVAIVLEFMPGGDLSGFIYSSDSKPDSPEARLLYENTANLFARDVARGLSYLHAFSPAPIIHRDIKPENVLLAGFLRAKIADLGEARFKTASDDMTSVGTPIYAAPEILSDAESYDVHVDTYSFGVMLNEMFARVRPYSVGAKFKPVRVVNSRERPKLFSDKHVRGKKLLSELIKRCWLPSPTNRPPIEVVLGALEAVDRGEEEFPFEQRISGASSDQHQLLETSSDVETILKRLVEQVEWFGETEIMMLKEHIAEGLRERIAAEARRVMAWKSEGKHLSRAVATDAELPKSKSGVASGARNRGSAVVPV